jgi:chorismate dehydratase
MLRVGCVKYLNALPLIRRGPGAVDFDHPSALCQRLADGDLDVALVSSFEFLRNPIYRIVDDVSVASDGPVYSVVLAHCGEPSHIQEIQLDPASRTSVNLLRCLLAEHGLKPRLSQNTGNIPMFLEAHRARLLIGDQAIRFRREHHNEFEFWDLGEQWKKLTGLPFVYALWLIRPEVADAESVAQYLRALRDQNLTNLDDLIEETVTAGVDPGRSAGFDREFLNSYYRKHIRFAFGEREKEGLQTFARLCVKHALLPSHDRGFDVV